LGPTQWKNKGKGRVAPTTMRNAPIPDPHRIEIPERRTGPSGGMRVIMGMWK
jgi:hypothetical protein